MISELLFKQQQMPKSLALLFPYIEALGYGCTLGETYRSPVQAEINAMGKDGREALAKLAENAFPVFAAKLRAITGKGIRNSLHTKRLAIDLQLFDAQGNWIQDTNAYQVVGEYWERIAAEHCAGFRFGDPPHLSITYQGVK